MVRRGSKLIPFLKDALKEKKYVNLKYEDIRNQMFSVFLPQNTKSLERVYQYVLKDWNEMKKRPYKFKEDYTDAKQIMEAALHRSDFLGLVRKGRNAKMIYRFLTPKEVQEKKSLKKALKKKRAPTPDPYAGLVYASSPDSSGYGSGTDHNEETYEGDGSDALLNALNHDHYYNHDVEKQHPEEDGSLNSATICHNAAGDNIWLHQDGHAVIANVIFDANGYMLKVEPVSADGSMQTWNMEALSMDENLALLNMKSVSPDGNMQMDAGFMEENLPMLIMEQVPMDGNQSILNIQPALAYENIQPMQVEDAKFENPRIGYEDSFHDEIQPIKYSGSCVPPGYQNSIDNQRITGLLDGNLLADDSDDSPQDLSDEDSLNSILEADLDPKQVEDIIKDLFLDSEERQMEKATLAMNDLNIASYKTKTIKVYECLHRAVMPGMVMLTCEPKFKEVADIYEHEQSEPKLIFDEATYLLMSNCKSKEFQTLPNDHLLIFLKSCNELIN